MTAVESAIPAHLRVERTHPPTVQPGFTPPYPSFVARHDPSVTQVTMAYLGLQHPGGGPLPLTAQQALDRLDADLGGPDGPGHWDRADHVDEAGCATVLTIAYWDDPSRYDLWAAVVDDWTADSRSGSGVGFFSEVLRPRVDRYETLLSSERPEGVAVLADRLSGAVQEHAYWGGARDRIPLAQHDRLAPGGTARVVSDGPRQRVTPQHNLCLIRSGQEWTETEGAERLMYLEDVEPVLRAGMDFLRDDGREIGCLANRYVRVRDAAGQPLDKTFGMSWWTSMGALGFWAQSHPTHVAIFAAASRYLSTMGPAAKLRLYHEVTVAAEDEQAFVYLDCHPATGLLRVAQLRS